MPHTSLTGSSAISFRCRCGQDKSTTPPVCRGHCFENGLIMRAVGDTMIIAPPLVISKDEIDELVEKARKCLDLTARAVLV